MRMADIEVGAYYEYVEWGSNGHKAKILETRVPVPGYRYLGVRIDVLGREKAVAARQIRRPWEEAQAEIDKAREREKQRVIRSAKFNRVRLHIEASLLSHDRMDSSIVKVYYDDWRACLSIDITDLDMAEWFASTLAETIEYVCPACTGVDHEVAIRSESYHDNDVIKCLDCGEVYAVIHNTNRVVGQLANDE